MKGFFRIIALVSALAGGSNLAAEATNLLANKAPVSLELRDQFDAPQKLSFPSTHVTLLTIADKQGSGQLEEWIAPVKKRFGSRIDIRGLADVSAVPRALRGLVLREFRKLITYPVMMDWSGAAVKAFTHVPGQANVLVLNRQGVIVHRLSGRATAVEIRNLCVVIDQALAATNTLSEAR
ncbi:MAG: hypothetical protein H7Y43_05315 [Akkermansiaceae bacterium]|nr:hypothetical protein [Verrucomicrobiales bacterium]